MGIRIEDGRVVNPEGLEVNATLQCNMRCQSCSHLAPLFRRENVDPVALRDTLTVLARYYHASYVKVLGGEPLMHPDLPGVLAAVRASAVSDTVLVCTNGTLLHRAPEAFWDAVDAVEVSVYPSRPLDADDIDRFRTTAANHGVSLEVNYYGHFRVAYSEHGTESPALVRDIFDTCKLAHLWLSHTVYDGWLFRCPQSVFLPKQLHETSWDNRVDGVRIDDDPEFPDRLVELLTRTSPLRACQHCLGSVGQLHPHQELARTQWRQDEPTERVIDHSYLELSKKDISVDDGCVDPTCPLPTGQPAG
jgi:hypothetical protein